MGWWAAIPIVDRITKWIDEWKDGAAARKAIKVSKLKQELAKVNTRLKHYEADFEDNANYAEYIKLLKRKRVLERKILHLAR